MKIHEITPKDYTDLHRLYCQLEDDWTSDIHDMIRVLEEVKDDPHYHLVGIFDDEDKAKKAFEDMKASGLARQIYLTRPFNQKIKSTRKNQRKR